MTIRGLNHITLAVSDIPRSVGFYRDWLGLEVAHVWDNGAYLSAGDLWLCLSLDAYTAPSKDYTHIAFDVSADDFASVAKRIRAAGAVVWKENSSEGDSLYFQDPDDHKLELHVGSLRTRLAAMTREVAPC